MKLRAEFAGVLFEELLPEAGKRERDCLVDHLEDLVRAGNLTRGAALDLERAAGAYAASMTEEAFVVGLECGRDLRRLMCA